MLSVGDNVVVEWTWGGSRFKAAGIVTKVSGKTVKVRLTEHAGEHFAPGFIVTAQAQNVHKDSNMKTAAQAPRMDSFTRAYFETALWSSTDESRDDGGDPLDENYSIGDIDEETSAKMIADCTDFQERYTELLVESGLDYDKAGHDFWLSRNGHGSGFFDEEVPHRDELQAAAESYGEFSLYVGDDGVIYGTPLESRSMREVRAAGGYTRRQSQNDALIDEVFLDGAAIGYTAGPFQSHSGAKKFYEWRLHGASPQDHPPFGLSPMSGRAPSRQAAFNSVVRAHKLKFSRGSVSEHRYPDPKPPQHHVTRRRVADFNTLDDLIAHARDELGATHVLFVDEEIHLYFPRRDGTFEKAEIWQKDGYWHAQGPGARAIVQKVPTGAQPIGGGRGQRAAEAQESKRDQVPTLPVIFRAERSGEHKGQVTAVFPTLPGTGPHDFTVYDGQHSVGSAGWYNNTRAATPSEYSRLLADLRNIYENDPDGPVKLHVVERFSHRYDIARRREWETTYRGGPQETTEFSAVHDHEAGGGRGQGVEASSAGRDTIPIAPGIEVRRMGQIEDAGYRWIDGWVVFVDGREHQPWMRKNDALRLARQFAQDRKSRTVRDYEAVDNRDRRIAGPFKHYGDAKTAAGPGGHVKYVRPRKATEASRHPKAKRSARRARKR